MYNVQGYKTMYSKSICKEPVYVTATCTCIMCMYIVHIKHPLHMYTHLYMIYTSVQKLFVCREQHCITFAFHYVDCTMYAHIYLLSYLQYSFETTSHNTIWKNPSILFDLLMHWSLNLSITVNLWCFLYLVSLRSWYFRIKP